MKVARKKRQAGVAAAGCRLHAVVAGEERAARRARRRFQQRSRSCQRVAVGLLRQATRNKLGVRAGATVALLGAPERIERLLEPLPEEVRIVSRQGTGAGVAVLFVRSRADLGRRFAGAAKAVAVGGRLWLASPGEASGTPTDLAQDGVRAFGLAAGWVDYRIAALDPTWSGLCFARRSVRP